MATDLSNNERDAFEQGGLALDCRRMTLRSHIDGNVWRVGAGYFRKSDAGKFQYVMFVPDAVGDAKAFLERLPIGGSLLEPADYVDFEALDTENRAWRASPATRFSSEVESEPGVVLTGEFDEVGCTGGEAEERPTRMYLLLPLPLAIPTNIFTRRLVEAAGQTYEGGLKRDRWQFKADSYELVFHDTGSATEIFIKSLNGTIEAGLDTRIEEAVWIAFSVHTVWAMLTKQGDESAALRLRASANRESVRTRFRPILDEHAQRPDTQLARFFADYFRHTRSYAIERYHPIAVAYKQVLLASAINLEAEAQALGAAVETVLREEFGDLWEEDHGFIAEVAGAKEHLESWNGEESAKRRILGLLDRLGTANAETVLRNLVKQHRLTNEHVDAWRSVRHSSAHGRQRDGTFRDLLDACTRTHQLLVLLVLHAIGYEGHLLDETLRGSHYLTLKHGQLQGG
jgi:hypothetical protein